MSRTLGSTPADGGEGAASLQLRLIKLIAAARQPLLPSLAALALAAAASTAPPPNVTPSHVPEALLPPLSVIAIPAASGGGGGADEVAGDVDGEGGTRTGGVEGMADAAEEEDDDDDEGDLLSG